MTPVWVHHTDANYQGIVAFVSDRIWGRFKPFPLGNALAIIKNETLIAGVIVNGYNKETGTCEISGASDDPRFLTKRVLYKIYDFTFNQMGCQAVIQRNDPENTSLARMLTAYGFKRYDIPRLRGRDKAEAVFVLAEEDWRANGFHKENLV